MKKTLSINHHLAIFFGFIILLLGVRFFFAKNLQFSFLIWNIFLAYIPYGITIFLKKHFDNKAIFFIGIGLWLLFFPNSLYIVTDLLHLRLISGIPKWFDIILLYSSSILGLLFAFASLFIIEQGLRKYFPVKKINILVIAFFVAGSFGVYLGRFLRWNSWNIINKPLTLLQDIFERFLYPHAHLRTWGVTVVLSLLFYFLYTTLKKFSGVLNAKSF